MILEEDVVKILRRHLRSVPPGGVVDREKPLRAQGLDSLSAINLLVDLEQDLGIFFPDELLVEDTFATASNLIRAIRSLQEVRQS